MGERLRLSAINGKGRPAAATRQDCSQRSILLSVIVVEPLINADARVSNPADRTMVRIVLRWVICGICFVRGAISTPKILPAVFVAIAVGGGCDRNS